AVAFVARVFEHFVPGPRRDHQPDREWRRVRAGVVDRGAVLDHLRVHAPETLRELQPLAVRRPATVHADAGEIREVRGLDHERVALEAPARATEILANAGVERLAAVERNDTRVVDHFVSD